MPPLEHAAVATGESPSLLGGKGGRKKNRNNRDDSGRERDANGQFKKKNGKNGQNGKNQPTCGWVNDREYEKATDESKFKRAKDLHSWYDRFVRGIPKAVVAELSNDPSAKHVAWEVQSVVAQLKNVYLRAEEYLKIAESERNRLDGLNPKPVLKDATTDIPFSENNPMIEQLFRIDKLKYANLNLLSILSGINNEKLRMFAERWVQKDPSLRTQRVTPYFVALDYDPWYDVFFAHYGYEGYKSPPIVSVQFKLPPKTGNINDKEDCTGYNYQKVLTDAGHLIHIVNPISEGDNLWTLFKSRPITQRRPKTYTPSSSSVNDPLAPSPSYTLGGGRKTSRSKPPSKLKTT